MGSVNYLIFLSGSGVGIGNGIDRKKNIDQRTVASEQSLSIVGVGNSLAFLTSMRIFRMKKDVLSMKSH